MNKNYYSKFDFEKEILLNDGLNFKISKIKFKNQNYIKICVELCSNWLLLTILIEFQELIKRIKYFLNYNSIK